MLWLTADLFYWIALCSVLFVLFNVFLSPPEFNNSQTFTYRWWYYIINWFCLPSLINYYFHKERCLVNRTISTPLCIVLLVKFFISCSFLLILAFKNGITDSYSQKIKSWMPPTLLLCSCQPFPLRLLDVMQIS